MFPSHWKGGDEEVHRQEYQIQNFNLKYRVSKANVLLIWDAELENDCVKPRVVIDIHLLPCLVHFCPTEVWCLGAPSSLQSCSWALVPRRWDLGQDWSEVLGAGCWAKDWLEAVVLALGTSSPFLVGSCSSPGTGQRHLCRITRGEILQSSFWCFPCSCRSAISRYLEVLVYVCVFLVQTFDRAQRGTRCVTEPSLLSDFVLDSILISARTF